MIYWQSIYKIYKGNDITITDIDTINENKIMKILTSSISNYNDSALMTNNNNDNHGNHDKNNKS